MKKSGKGKYEAMCVAATNFSAPGAVLAVILSAKTLVSSDKE